VFLPPAKTFGLDIFQKNDDGYFKKLHSDFPVYGNPVKLQNGRVFITGRPDNLVFDPKANTFRKTTPFNDDIRPGSRILLGTGKVLFIGPITESPCDKFASEISVVLAKEKNYTREDFAKYRQLSEEDKKKIYLPLIQKDPELLKKYNDYLVLYERSMHAQLYNPETEQFEYTGKVNIRRSNPKTVLLKDGRVFIIGGMTARNPVIPIGIADDGIYSRACQIEIYDPETGIFGLINTSASLGRISDVILFNNENIFIRIENEYIIYNISNNTFSEPRFFGYGEILKLSDGRMLLFSAENSEFNTHKLSEPAIEKTKAQAYVYTWQRYNAMNIKIFDPEKEKFAATGHLAIPRGGVGAFGPILLSDGKVLIVGGEKNIEKRKLGDKAEAMNEAEILDTKTLKSKLINKMNYKRINDIELLLDDGRVLLYGGHQVELYLPRGYKK